MAQQVDVVEKNEQKEAKAVTTRTTIATINRNTKYKAEISIDETQKELTLDVQDKKSKRKFKGNYPISSLHESGFHSQHGLNDIKKVLETAFNKNDDSLQLTINYGNDKGLNDKYCNGDYMFWTILHDLKILNLTYNLKLNEVKQSDSDILHQIIDDLSNEIKHLKIENKKLSFQTRRLTDTIISIHPVIARWDCKNMKVGNNKFVKWTDLKFMTMEGHFELTDDSMHIRILQNGLYRIKCRLWLRSDTNYAFYHFLIDNEKMQKVFGSTDNGQYHHLNGLIDAVYQLRSEQILSFEVTVGKLYEDSQCMENNFVHIEKVLSYYHD